MEFAEINSPQMDSARDEADLTKLSQRIRSSWTVQTEVLEIEDWSFSFWTVDRPEESLDRLMHTEGAALVWEPYWAQSWVTAQDCARALRQLRLDGQRVLDLGCGLGVAGAAAASKGAKVWLVDNAPPALLFARRNTWPWRERVTIRRADWNADRLGLAFDLIVGSDILYDTTQWPALQEFWRRHLKPAGHLLLGEPSRTGSGGFDGWLETQGWGVESTPSKNGRLLTAYRQTT